MCKTPAYDCPYCSSHPQEFYQHNYANLSLNVFPGEGFTVPIFLVGVDYGTCTTTGVAYSDIVPPLNSSDVMLDSDPENGRVVSNNKQCTSLNFSLSSNVSNNVHKPRKL